MSLVQIDAARAPMPNPFVFSEGPEALFPQATLMLTEELPFNSIEDANVLRSQGLQRLFEAQVEWQPIVDEGLAERHTANDLSDGRAKRAGIIGAMVLVCEEKASTRIATAAVLGQAWYTDRQDGQHARHSTSLLLEAVEQYPELLFHPQVIELLSAEMTAVGGRKDEQADKILTDAITKALLERAVRSGDLVAAAVLGATDHITRQYRNPRMEKLRQFGRKHNINVGAKWAGKLKTGMLAVGQGAMVLGKTGGKLNRFGLGLVAASNAPSWGAVYQMYKHVSAQVAAQQPAADWIKMAPDEFTKYKLIRDAEGEPLEPLAAA